MSKHIMAICDKEAEYANRFQEYLSRKKAFLFQVQIFTSPEQLLLFSEKNKIEILVISENSYSEKMNQIKTNHLVVLSEKGTTAGEDLFIIPKYQSSEKIIHEIMYYYEKLNTGNIFLQSTKEVKMIGVYTPVGRCLQTSFSLLLGQLLSKRHKILYLNFEAFSGFGKFMKREFQTDIIDMMYLTNHMQDNFHSKFQNMVEHIHNLDYIPPAFSFMDLSAVSGEKWIQFLDTIKQMGDYEYIILDLSDNIQGLLSILQKCDTIYTLIKEDGMAMAKIDQYEKLLKTMEYQDIIDHTKRFQFPCFKSIPMEVEELPFCELAKYVKAILKEDLHEELS